MIELVEKEVRLSEMSTEELNGQYCLCLDSYNAFRKQKSKIAKELAEQEYKKLVAIDHELYFRITGKSF